MSSSKAWATLLTNAAYVPAILTLNSTLTKVSEYPLLALVTDSFPQNFHPIIKNAGIIPVAIPTLNPPPERVPKVGDGLERFHDVWTKLRVFGLTDYDRIILIDSDMLFLRPMDELFDMPLPGRDWIAAVPGCICNPTGLKDYPKELIPENCALRKQKTHWSVDSTPIPPKDGPNYVHRFNSGLVVLQPSNTQMEAIETHLRDSPDVINYGFPDQDLLMHLYKGRWKPLPWWANAFQTARAVHPDVWDDEEVRLIHYTLEKPWNNRPREPVQVEEPPRTSLDAEHGTLQLDLVEAVSDTPPQKSKTKYDAVHRWWWIAYEHLLNELKERSKEDWLSVTKLVKD